MKYDSTTIILEGEPLRLSFSFSRFSGRRREVREIFTLALVKTPLS